MIKVRENGCPAVAAACPVAIDIFRSFGILLDMPGLIEICCMGWEDVHGHLLDDSQKFMVEVHLGEWIGRIHAVDKSLEYIQSLAEDAMRDI